MSEQLEPAGADARALELIAYLAGNAQPVSAGRVCKSLGLSRSELNRLLVALGNSPGCEGMGLVDSTREGERDLLWLSASGHELWARSSR